jgi:hypothetical protein
MFSLKRNPKPSVSSDVILSAKSRGEMTIALKELKDAVAKVERITLGTNDDE